MNKLLTKIKSLPYYDKILHFVGGMLVIGAYFGLFKLALLISMQSYTAEIYIMFAPYFVAAIFSAVLVHGAKEVQDYLAMKRGENATPSLYDFAAGMAGSLFVLYLMS